MMPAVPNSLRSLLTDLVDYAGLFPPAKLGMQSAVEMYNRSRMGGEEWMLGRFICPVSRLGEFEQCASVLMPGTAGTSGYREMVDAGQSWRLSVLVDVAQLGKELDAIHQFNERHAVEANGLAEIDMCELKISSPSQIDGVLDEWPEGLFPFFEFPVTTDCRGFVAALSGSPAGAKIRTGGVVGDAFPQVGEVSEFLRACAASEVSFKATAGLHHAVRGAYRLTYEKDSASCTMHGFLNVFIAAAMVKAKGIDDATVRAILSEEDAANFKFSEAALGWKSHLVETAQVAMVREGFALSFGSCSFDEPVGEVGRVTE